MPIAFVLAKLNPAQRKYSVTEQECLTALVALKRFRPFVEGQTLKIITDHASLKLLMSQPHFSVRSARWSLKIQESTFIIEYRK
jgi:hypothetical protein